MFLLQSGPAETLITTDVSNMKGAELTMPKRAEKQVAKEAATVSDYKRYALVVLGMHRSGTSALAGALARLGADVPKTEMKPTADNPRGYYESDTIRHFNDRILDSAGSSWDDWAPIPATWFSGPRAISLQDEARRTIASEFGRSPLFVLKDPRMCRLWPFWENVLKAESVDPIILINHRNSAEVAASLKRRDDTPLVLGRLIWLRHQLDAERYTRELPRIFTSYQGLLYSWRDIVNRLEAAAGFSLPRRSTRTEIEIDDFLSSNLRHFTADHTSAAPGPEVLDNAEKVLTSLLGHAENASNRKTLDRCEIELSAHGPGFYEISTYAQNRGRELRKLTDQYEELKHSNQELAEQLEELKAENKELSGPLAELQAGNKRLSEQLEELKAENKELSGPLAELQAGNKRLSEQLEEIKAGNKELICENGRIQQQHQELAKRKTELENSISQIRAERDSLKAQYSEKVGELAKMARITADRETQLITKIQEKHRDDLKSNEVRILKGIHNSRSWRLTAPLRFVTRHWRRLYRRRGG